jgi:hypothetical protein
LLDLWALKRGRAASMNRSFYVQFPEEVSTDYGKSCGAPSENGITCPYLTWEGCQRPLNLRYPPIVSYPLFSYCLCTLGRAIRLQTSGQGWPYHNRLVCGFSQRCMRLESSIDVSVGGFDRESR